MTRHSPALFGPRITAGSARCAWLLVFCFTSAVVYADDAELAARAVTLLRAKCGDCHGAGDLTEAGLDLTSRAALLRGGESKRPLLNVEQPEESPLYQAVARKDPDTAMPPDDSDRLTAEQVRAIRDWLAAGAPWSEKQPAKAWETPSASVGVDGIEIATSGGLSEDWTHRRYQPADVWAYQPVRRYAVPRGATAGVVHPIDAFLQARLARGGLSAAPPADRATWLRRAMFDLTGLPPPPEEVDAFVRDDAPQAVERAIDRLLASPHYGEQMARRWLDVTRYSDTSGFSNDYERPHAWRYRDYVVRSFNADKPFDRFVVEQLAGDELDPSDPEMLIAVGYLRMGPWEHTSMSVAVETRQQFLDDVTHGVGVTFLGQGLRCAKCHDHKFDPVPTRDYYRLQAVFAPTQFLDRDVPWLPAEDVSSLATSRPRTERLLRDAQDYLEGLKQKRDAAVAQWLTEHGHKSLDEVPGDQRPPRHLGLTDLEMSLEKVYQKRVNYFQLEMRRFEPQALSVYDGPLTLFDMTLGKPTGRRGKGGKAVADGSLGTLQVVHVLRGGALDAPGDRVTPGVLSAVFGSNDSAQPSAWNTVPQSAEGRRLALARWIASDQNPLTARVIVNRVWQQHFGRGLVATSNNFGKMGSRPTHPELLDWLATWFMEHGWSVKRLHRLIMTSHAYGQSSEHPEPAKLAAADAKNEGLAVFPARRLDAEELRDAMLAVSGELNGRLGGPPTFPELNWEVALQPRHIMGSVAPAYQPSPKPAERHRRTLYAFHCRTLGDPLLEVFNKPGSDLSCERRDQTTVAPQVFALFNGQAVHDRALAFARRLETLADKPEERVDAAFRLAYGRAADRDERTRCLEHVRRMTEHHRAHPPTKSDVPRRVRREMVEELTGEVFQWEEDLDLMADFVPDLKPWDVGPETRAWAELCLVLLNSNEFVYIR